MTKEFYSIWSEGYEATGNSGGSHYHGSAEGENFKDACINFANSNPSFKAYFDEEDLSYWGCRLYEG